jgi:single-strand DNA-binding protein
VSLIEQYARKGDQLYLEGRLVLDQWDDKTTGQKRSKHKLVVENLELLGARNNEGDGVGGRPAGNVGGRPAAHSSAPPDDGGDEYGGGGTGGGSGADGDPIPF